MKYLFLLKKLKKLHGSNISKDISGWNKETSWSEQQRKSDE
jgi:hypothetical protein